MSFLVSLSLSLSLSLCPPQLMFALYPPSLSLSLSPSLSLSLSPAAPSLSHTHYKQVTNPYNNL